EQHLECKEWQILGPLGIEVVQEFSLPLGRLCVSVGSVERFTGDAIVNAANEACLGGGGVDGAISKAGGKKLLDARKGLPAKSGKRCPTRHAVVTTGGDLAAKWCIHAVAPRYPGKGTPGEKNAAQLADCDALLEGAAQMAMKLAAEKRVKTIAFPILGSGIFRGCRSLKEVVAANLRGICAGAYEGPPAEVAEAVAGGAAEAAPAAPSLVRVASEQVQAVFREWDTNMDGCLSVADMSRVLAEIGISKEDAEKLFNEADLNKDGMLDYAEFTQWLYTDSNKEFRDHVFHKRARLQRFTGM
ncbi:unnamed protein product, partial [Cladocopium goreaui]